MIYCAGESWFIILSFIGSIIIHYQNTDMGYASYLEDITNKFGEFERAIEKHNEKSEKKIDITEYGYIRSQVMRLIKALKPYVEKNIDLDEALNLKRDKESLEISLKSVMEQKEKLVKRFAEFKEESHRVEKYLVEEKAVKSTLSELKFQNEQLLLEFESLKNNYTDILFDTSSLFKELQKLTNNPNWITNKETVKEIERCIKMGSKKLSH